MSTPKRRGALALLVCAVAGDAAGEAWTFRVGPEETRAAFAVTYLGFAKQTGRFESASGTIVLDRERRAGTVDLAIDVGSVRTGWDLRDSFLRGESMFDAERYPTLNFHSTRLGFDGGKLVAIDGEITLRGVTRPVRLEVVHLDCGAAEAREREPEPPAMRDGAKSAASARLGCAARVSGRISRAAFGMDFAYPLIGDDVDLDIAVEALSSPRPATIR